MSTGYDSLAGNPQHESRSHPQDERVAPAIFARQLFEHLSDVHGDADADLYVSRVAAELFELSPIAREHISDLFFADLSDELSRRGEAEAVRAVLEVQSHCDQEDGRQ